MGSVSAETWSYSLTHNFILRTVPKSWKATVEFGLYRVDCSQMEGHGGLSGDSQTPCRVGTKPPLRSRGAFKKMEGATLVMRVLDLNDQASACPMSRAQMRVDALFFDLHNSHGWGQRVRLGTL